MISASYYDAQVGSLIIFKNGAKIARRAFKRILGIAAAIFAPFCIYYQSTARTLLKKMIILTRSISFKAKASRCFP